MPENTQPAKTKFKIDLFQTARVHSESFVEEFNTEAEAKAYIEGLCKDKGVKPDYEIEALPEPEAPSEEVSEGESENSPEESDEKTTQENSLQLN